MSPSATSRCFLNTPREADLTISLGSLFQFLTPLPVKKFLLISNLNLSGAIWGHFLLSYQTSLGYSFPFLSPKPPFLQTEHPHLSQPLLTHHVPQTLPQLQNLFFKAKGPKFNTEFEVSKPINTTEIPQPLCTQRGIFSSWCTHSWGCSSASVHPSCSLLCQTPSPPSIRPHQVFNDHTPWQWREQISPSRDSKIPCMKQSHKELSTFAGLEFVICHFLYYGNAPHLC